LRATTKPVTDSAFGDRFSMGGNVAPLFAPKLKNPIFNN